jgi:hypothetical protein
LQKKKSRRNDVSGLVDDGLLCREMVVQQAEQERHDNSDGELVVFGRQDRPKTKERERGRAQLEQGDASQFVCEGESSQTDKRDAMQK